MCDTVHTLHNTNTSINWPSNVRRSYKEWDHDKLVSVAWYYAVVCPLHLFWYSERTNSTQWWILIVFSEEMTVWLCLFLVSLLCIWISFSMWMLKFWLFVILLAATSVCILLSIILFDISIIICDCHFKVNRCKGLMLFVTFRTCFTMSG